MSEMNEVYMTTKLPVSLAEQLAAVRADPARLDARNRFGGAYASLASVLDAARKALEGTGLAFAQLIDCEPVQNDDGTLMELLTVTTRLFNAAGESLESRMSVVCDANPQIIGSYITYFRRYQIASVLGIVAEEDDDGEDAAKAGASGKSGVPARTVQSPKFPKSPQTTDTITAFWAEAKRLGLTAEQGQALVQAAGGDFGKALAGLQEGNSGGDR